MLAKRYVECIDNTSVEKYSLDNLDLDIIQARINAEEMKVIGYAGWIDHVEYLH